MKDECDHLPLALLAAPRVWCVAGFLDFLVRVGERCVCVLGWGGIGVGELKGECWDHIVYCVVAA